MSDSIFTKIINREIPSKIEFENDELIVIHDINPQAPLHLLVIPKKEIDKISSMEESDSALVGRMIECGQSVAKKLGYEDFRLVFNNGAEAGQEVFHIHLHVLAGRSFSWPPG